jgi:colanic acid biosynthesis glycosyl transferase WcaI
MDVRTQSAGQNRGEVLRILVYCINFSPELTGIGKYTGEMCAWLAQRGHEVRVVTAPPYYPEWRIKSGYSGWQYRVDRTSLMRVFRCPVWVPQRPNGLKRLIHLTSFALFSLPVVLWQVLWRPQVVITLEPPILCAPAAWLVARLARARDWLHVQDFEVDTAFDLGLLPRRLKAPVLYTERFMLRAFNRVSTISRRMLARLSEKGLDLARCVLFSNWVDCNTIFPSNTPSPFRRELGIPDDAFVALYSGNMGEKQGLDIVVEAARRLASQGEIAFVLCGDGAARARLKAQSTALKNVHWLPLQPAERLNDLLNLADVHLLPQRVRAADLVMPSKLGGMLASGRPVIATVNPGTEIAEALTIAGIVTPPGDVDALVRALVRLEADTVGRRNMGMSARLQAERMFSASAILEEFERELLRCAAVE